MVAGRLSHVELQDMAHEADLTPDFLDSLGYRILQYGCDALQELDADQAYAVMRLAAAGLRGAGWQDEAGKEAG